MGAILDKPDRSINRHEAEFAPRQLRRNEPRGRATLVGRELLSGLAVGMRVGMESSADG
jgi:hypothetical protein